MTSTHRVVSTLCLTMTVSAALAVRGDDADVTMPRSPHDKLLADTQAPTVIAIRVHHDLCPYCKKLAPAFSRLVRAADGEGATLFVTLDFSTPASQRQAGLLLTALGLQNHWTGDYSSLGSVTLVDGTTKATIATYRPGGEETLAAVLADAIEAATR